MNIVDQIYLQRTLNPNSSHYNHKSCCYKNVCSRNNFTVNHLQEGESHSSSESTICHYKLLLEVYAFHAERICNWCENIYTNESKKHLKIKGKLCGVKHSARVKSHSGLCNISEKVFWLRMETKLQEKKEEENNRDTVTTVTWGFTNLVLLVINLLVLVVLC